MTNNEIRLNEKQRKMVIENLNIVQIIVNKMKPKGESFIVNGYHYNDACQDGYYALCKAAYYYKDNLNVKFVTYASKAVKMEILKEIDKCKKHISISLDADNGVDYAVDNDFCYESENKELYDKVIEIINRKRKEFSTKKTKSAVGYEIFYERCFLRKDYKELMRKYNLQYMEVAHLCAGAKRDLIRTVSKEISYV